MAARRAWYRSAEYKQPMGPKTLGDGSEVAVRPHPYARECLVTGKDELFPDAMLILRRYRDGYTQRIVISQRSDGSTHYLLEDPGPEAHDRRPMDDPGRAKEFDQAIANGELNITARGPIPGAGLGVHYDRVTRKRYGSTEEFEREYDRQKISKIGRSDHSTMHTPSEEQLDAQADRVIDQAFEQEFAQMSANRLAERAAGGGPPTISFDNSTGVQPFRVDSPNAMPPAPVVKR